MKILARYLIYIGCMGLAVMALLNPVMVWLDTGYLDVQDAVIHAVIGFSLVFAGTEISEALKKRWEA